MLSDESMAEMATPIAAAAVGTSDSDDDQGVVGKLITHFENALIWERNFYAILLGVWLGLALIGLIVVLWHSGGRDRYHAWRGTTPPDDGGDRDRRWNGNTNDQHPIYDNYAEKEFRGITLTGEVPHIVEPELHTATTGRGRSPGGTRTTNSFFDYPRSDGDTRRPFVPRKGTFGAGISSLVAPGQAFLKMTRGASSDGHDRLVEKGESSENYNHGVYDEKRNHNHDEVLESPPPFWVNRFYGGLKSLFPTKGQRHGAALERKEIRRQIFRSERVGSQALPRLEAIGLTLPGRSMVNGR
jgi:hypothetical protein